MSLAFHVTVMVAGATVTAQVAVTPLPSLAVAVMLAVPAATAVTSPVKASTDATAALSLLQVTVWSVASSGVTVAVSVSVEPTLVEIAVLFSVMAVTGIVAAFTTALMLFTFFVPV